MYWDITTVKAEDDFTLQVTFADGLHGKVKFKHSFLTGVFEALKDKAYFKKVYLDHGVVTWPGELDIAPDAMHNEIKKNGIWILS